MVRSKGSKDVNPKFSNTLRSIALTGKKHPKKCGHCVWVRKHNIGNQYTKGFIASFETRQKHRIWMLDNRYKWVCPLKDTSIENIAHNFLISRGHKVKKHKVFDAGYTSHHQVDRFLPAYCLAIECDGKYWHSLPDSLRHDRCINDSMFNQGVNLLRLSEDEILSGEFKSRMIMELGL